MALQFELVKIGTPQFAIINDNEVSEPLQINLEVNFAVDKDISSIKNTIKVVYLNSNEPVMQLIVDCYYSVSPDSWKEMTNSDNSIIVPVGFLQHIATITVGTTRGILHEKTEGTNMNKYILPLINVTEMVKNNMVVMPKTTPSTK